MRVYIEPGECKLHLACEMVLRPKPEPERPKPRPMPEYRANRYLTEEQIRGLQNLAMQGFTCPEISRMSGRALSTIQTYCSHLAPKGRRYVSPKGPRNAH